MEGAGQPDSQDGIDALRLRVQNEQEAFDAFSKRITSWFLLFAFSDGTSPDFGPSSRGFIESLTGVHLEEPQDQELVMWKSIYSCIHRQNFQFQVLWAYNLTRHIKAWNPADEVFINVFDFPTGSAAPTLPTSRAA